MELDIQPQIEKAKGIDKICLEMREIDSLYVVRTSDGKDYTVKWELDEMLGFQPNKTVSEMMKTWEDGLKRQLKTAEKVIKTKNHPTWKQWVYDDKGKAIGQKPYRLSDTRNFEISAERIKKQLGKMTIVKITL